MSNPVTTPKDKLIGLINAANPGKNFTAAQLNFSVPTTNGAGKNTKVTVSPAPGYPYTGTVDITYNRVQLSLIVGAISNEFVLDTQDNTTDLVAALVERFGRLITADDIVAAALPAADQYGTITATIQAAPGSYLWLGSVDVVLKPATVPLSEAIAVNDLDGFDLDDLEA